MSNYVKLTDFASKDALPTGTPAKIIKGTEIDDEFQAIENTMATKADTTALTAAINAIDLTVLWPVGSVYINAGVATNPSVLLGFGTWTEIGAGKVLVGQDTGDTDFDVLGETGGTKDAVVVSHTHTGTTSTNGEHTHTYAYVGGYGSIINQGDNFNYIDNKNTGSAGSHNHSFTTDSTGEDGTGKNLQPYVVVKMWQRTA